jgi:hypothetical protein
MDRTRDGNAFDGKSLARFVNPGVPEVTARLTSLTLEICRYPVDGINLDAMHYNYRADMGYHPDVMAGFEAETGLAANEIEPDMARGSDWMRWTIYREDKLTSLVQGIRRVCLEQSSAAGRRIMLSAVVQPGYEQNRGANFRYQHWSQWVGEELVDAATPACFDGDLPGLERQLWEVRSIQMGSDVACLPGFMLDTPRGTAGGARHNEGPGKVAHPSLADQKRLLRNAGFQYCNIMDYQALLFEKTVQPKAKSATRGNGFWGLFRDRSERED